MTREEAIEHLSEWMDEKMWRCFGTIDREAIGMAIEALSRSGDLISRADAIEMAVDVETPQGTYERAIYVDDLMALPSAEAVQGWIPSDLVRCKDCRHFKKIVERSDSGVCYRDIVASVWKENSYCSRGERREP